MFGRKQRQTHYCPVCSRVIASLAFGPEGIVAINHDGMTCTPPATRLRDLAIQTQERAATTRAEVRLTRALVGV